MTVSDAVRLIRGQKGTKGPLDYLHEGAKEPQKYTIVREVTPIKSVKSKMLEEGHGLSGSAPSRIKPMMMLKRP